MQRQPKARLVRRPWDPRVDDDEVRAVDEPERGPARSDESGNALDKCLRDVRRRHRVEQCRRELLQPSHVAERRFGGRRCRRRLLATASQRLADQDDCEPDPQGRQPARDLDALKVVRDEHELDELERPAQRERDRSRPEPPEPRRHGRDSDECRVELRIVGRQREGDEHASRRQDDGERVAGDPASVHVPVRRGDPLAHPRPGREGRQTCLLGRQTVMSATETKGYA